MRKHFKLDKLKATCADMLDQLRDSISGSAHAVPTGTNPTAQNTDYRLLQP